MLCDWSTAYFTSLLLILFFQIFLVVTTRQLDQRWVQPITNSFFEWLEIHLQALCKSFKDIIDATQNFSSLKAQHCSPQLIVFPKIRHPSNYKTPTDTQRFQFLSLPLELRLKVYGFFFATEVYKPFELGNGIHNVHKATMFILRSSLVLTSPTSLTSYWPVVKIQHSKEATANSKIPLLLANKAIYAEARPIFYRNHTFRFEYGKEGELVSCGPNWTFDQLLALMTKMELTNSEHYFPYNAREIWFQRQLFLLAKSCPRLRSLEVDYHTHERAKLPPRLQELWARLIHVEMRITSWNQMSDEVMVRRLECIAPAKLWRKVGVKKLDGYYFRFNGDRAIIPGLFQHVFRLDRLSSQGERSQEFL